MADNDHGQWFGLPRPIDAEARARGLLGGRSIIAATIDRQTADIMLTFDGGVRLDAFNNSSGHEGWEAHYPLGGRRQMAIALGGGDVSFLPGA